MIYPAEPIEALKNPDQAIRDALVNPIGDSDPLTALLTPGMKLTIAFDDIPAKVRELLVEFKANRLPGERFTNYWGRFRGLGPAPTPEQFHIEFAERAAKLAGEAVSAAE